MKKLMFVFSVLTALAVVAAPAPAPKKVNPVKASQEAWWALKKSTDALISKNFKGGFANYWHNDIDAALKKLEEELQKDSDKKVIDKDGCGPYSDVNDILPKLSEEERKIVSALLNGQRLVDDVIAETGMTTGKILAILTMLELKKVIVRYPGKRIGLK